MHDTLIAQWREHLLRTSAVHVVAHDEPGLFEAADDLRFEIFRIDLGGAEDKAALLRVIADGISAPEYFGHNWDALADVLSDFWWAPAPGYVLAIAGLEMGGAVGHHSAVLLEVIGRAGQRMHEFGTPLHAILVGVPPGSMGSVQVCDHVTKRDRAPTEPPARRARGKPEAP